MVGRDGLAEESAPPRVRSGASIIVRGSDRGNAGIRGWGLLIFKDFFGGIVKIR